MTRKAASVVIADERGRVLLIHEDYGRHRWGLPGGRHEPGESIEETAIREAKEETNLDVELGELIGTYLIVRAGGEKLLDVAVFVASIVGGELKPNEGEIADVGWFDPNEMPGPTTDVGPRAIADWVRGERGVNRRVVSPH
ncbi:MAG TPA: NUDIX hydrolase [Gemmatimonadaceae bacterium]|nr:NUDIX hydrolase [Gemmatimonadaceae bacterium]